ncbi:MULTISPECIES: hypothetical protein [Vibrio]|jgi:HTH-type transcriptional regulator/antitoxin HigA|uniref:Uncharacterized protein n=4 Tax=Vibrio TaxID=662 RepID=A0A7Z1MLB6_9VIBR|nr:MULTISPECIES: hypothetical protein [Vibrio]OEE58607.1 hypothetical protein A147_04610 [Vibrio splendidus FF-6]PMP21888.1 hypothetical protein BCS91_19120 [Vibrio cyclitrophicus]PMP31558.1 hypothetical protein BCS90_11230 [Vibrio cyclitrophicus]PTP19232.1 hypothetical protein CWO36_11140 [Vibrio splendidus]TKG08556.1 hypothetical protein FCV91_12460 [Vibrio lentus]
MSKKKLSEKELLKGITPETAHADGLATVSLDEVGLEPSESDYKAVLKRIESLFDVAEPGTPEGDELEKLVIWVEGYEEDHFPF